MKVFLPLSVAVLLLISTLVGCASGHNESTQSKLRPESPTKQSEAPFVEERAESIDLEQEDTDLDYVSFIMPFGYLLTSKGWDAVDELSVTELVMWYADFERSSHADNASYMRKYLIDGKDGFYFPQEEFESTVKQFFDISADILRTDNLIYSSVDEVYITPAAVPMVEKKIALVEVIKNGNILELHFDLTVNNAISSKIITIQKNKDSIQYISYVWV